MITTPAKGALCPRCRLPILTGHAEGIPARVDPIALNRAGLIAAILTNRPTYRLTRTGLVELDQERIRATNIHGPIVTTHRCGSAIPPEHRDTATPTAESKPAEGIPF